MNKPTGQICGTSFTLTEDWTENIPGLGVLTLKKGWTGESSIPYFAWSLLKIHPISEEVLIAGLVHDWLYRTKIVSRSSADNIYFILCVCNGCSMKKANIMYDTLRIAGWYRWNKLGRKEKQRALSLGVLLKINGALK